MTNIYDSTNISSQEAARHLPAAAANSASAVSWGAIFAGAAAAASLALMLLMLGAGLGLTSISPWENQGLAAGTVGIAAIAWLTFTQIVASGMGGYLAGRLRTKWVDTHTNEIYFRDTAHGFLTWAVALLVSAVLLTTTISSLIGGSAKIVGSVAGGATATAVNNAGEGSSMLSKSSMEYFTRSLFRASGSTPAGNSNVSGNDAMAMNQPVPPKAESPAQLAEVTGIFANSIYSGALPQDDLTYVAQLVSQNTGISQQEAEQRVQAVYDKAQANLKEAKDKAQQAADAARKTTSYVTLWSFISLLIGAFVASLCATYGGRQRDL
ncbi:hypothetical protein DN614_18765 [Klebsiella michiganensis]|uniref:hypothetical protein n=1 Tax=Klebsiella michiganensis TaxID=1134687 RepID=UPI000FEB94C9|nr:hypothetical protein [Klebsiella michiganensis]MBK4129201.1 hypothetical protein [Klebsiella michiganensis]MDS7800340.1 hypothetical protein [Klebsiella michiganensis]QHO86246.1 hypothetical protein CHQ91_10420 [Klebsiella michiganensis]QLS20404.1 hypothetical protein HV324_15015 [Klebsiella michiganensis]QMR53515.1 hypothetical protein HV264_00495 [Klebsiella michiganensis]